MRSPLSSPLALPSPIALAAFMLIAAGCLTAPAGPSLAQNADTEVTALSERLLFVVSGGYWEEADVAAETAPAGEGEPASEAEPGDTEPGAEAEAETKTGPETASPAEEEAAPPARRGYYRLVALRAEDNTSRVYLQQMRLGESGPQVEMTTDIEEISSQSAYVTNITQEGGGAAGFSAFIYAKSDPKLPEPDTWTVFVDEFGELSVERATN
jgi:hypothetical protein